MSKYNVGQEYKAGPVCKQERPVEEFNTETGCLCCWDIKQEQEYQTRIAEIDGDNRDNTYGGRAPYEGCMICGLTHDPPEHPIRTYSDALDIGRED